MIFDKMFVNISNRHIPGTVIDSGIIIKLEVDKEYAKA